jgi:alpha-ketoglutarate-dependent taurine dioxygenase
MAGPSNSVDFSFDLRPLGDGMGAEIRGLDLSKPVDDRLFAEIRMALLAHLVLVFRDQHFTEDAQVAFSRRLGELQVHVLDQYVADRNPAILFLTNLDQDGRPKGEHPDPGSVIWHTDGSWSARRPLVTMLYAMEIPKSGGDTLFANMYAAYDGLPVELKHRLEGMSAVHSLDYSRRLTGAKQQMTEAQKRAAPPVEHPIIRTHPETGRKTIYLGQHASHIAGMPVEEGRALVEQINIHATQVAYRWVQRWSRYDCVLWDNRCVLHCATDFDWLGDRRVMRRTTVLGEHLAA